MRHPHGPYRHVLLDDTTDLPKLIARVTSSDAWQIAVSVKCHRQLQFSIAGANAAVPGEISFVCNDNNLPDTERPVDLSKVHSFLNRSIFDCLQRKYVHAGFDLDDNTTAECERCKASSEEALILDWPKHMANRGDEDQIIIAAEFVAL